MDCCRGAVCGQVFGESVARHDLKRYRGKGLRPIERRMLASLPGSQVKGARVLEIGGGIGTLQAELLASGAATGEIIELVPAYEPFARELARSRGLTGRTSFRVADLLAGEASVAPAEIVILNGVVCCTPDGLALTREAATLTLGTLLLSYPRPAWWNRMAVGALNGFMAIRGRDYRAFVRPTSEMVAAAASAGLRLSAQQRGPYWEFVALST
jgi:hypothetical protein